VWDHFFGKDLAEYIVQVDEEGGENKLLGLFKKGLNPELAYERKVFLALSKIPLDTTDPIIDRLLSSVYMVLADKPTCARNGQHWI